MTRLNEYYKPTNEMKNREEAYSKSLASSKGMPQKINYPLYSNQKQLT